MAKPTPATPDGIFSLLDTDLYKLTMQCAVLKYFPNTGNILPTGRLGTRLLSHLVIDVEYAFTNRTPQMTFTRDAFSWLKQQVESRGTSIAGIFLGLTLAPTN